MSVICINIDTCYLILIDGLRSQLNGDLNEIYRICVTDGNVDRHHIATFTLISKLVWQHNYSSQSNIGLQPQNLSQLVEWPLNDESSTCVL